MSDELNHSMGLTNPPNSKPYALRGKIMVSAIIILFFVVIVMVSLHLYARWYLLRARRRQLLRRRSRLNHATRRTTQQQIVFYVDNSNPTNRGLEPAVFNSLPEFIYSSKTHHPEVSDCAVCLSEFEENETGRILPKCKHCFHVECIDMWFHSHSTCPLCRAPVEKFSDDNCSDSNSDHVVIDLGDPEPSRTDPDGETGTCSLGERRKEMRIEIPRTSELENHELRLSSPGVSQEFRSPGNRLLSFKRLLSMGKKTPTTPTPPVGSTTMPCGAAGTSSDFGSNRERVFSPHMHDITQPAEHMVCQHVQNIS